MHGLTDVDEIKGHTEAIAKLQMAKEDLQSINEELQLEVKEHEQADKQLLRQRILLRQLQ